MENSEAKKILINVMNKNNKNSSIIIDTCYSDDQIHKIICQINEVYPAEWTVYNVPSKISYNISKDVKTIFKV